MYEVLQTREFERWHKSLRDSRAVARVTTAVERLQLGLIIDRAKKVKDEYDA